MFLHVTGEEGLLGSAYYTENPLYPLEQTIVNLNIDMIGRNDPLHDTDDDYLYLIGSDILSQDLHDISVLINEKYSKLDLDFRYNDPMLKVYEREDIMLIVIIIDLIIIILPKMIYLLSSTLVAHMRIITFQLIPSKK